MNAIPSRSHATELTSCGEYWIGSKVADRKIEDRKRTHSLGQYLSIFLSFALGVSVAQVQFIHTFTGDQSSVAQRWPQASNQAKSAPGRFVDKPWSI
jgi:hypothetical protein